MKHEESISQRQFVAWFRYTYKDVLMFSIPNGAMLAGTPKQRAMRWAILEKEGALSGTADLMIAQPTAKYPGLFLEMKSSSGRQSTTQKEFKRKALNAGYHYAIAKSYEQAQQVILDYFQE